MVGRLTEDQMDILENMIGSSPKSFKLLYSITRDGRSAADFHQRCDNQGPTVTVLYNPRGSIYGGYAGVSWQSSGGYTADDTAFIFQLLFSGKRVVNTFRPKNVSKALYFCHDDSPHFGAQDLKAFSKIVSLNTDGTFNLNGKLAVGTYYHSNNVTNENINNGIMVVTEMEVYAVSDEARKSPPKGTAWRKTPNLNAEYTSKMTEELSLIKPQSGRGITDFRLLLVGPIAAGKSSFINTVMSAFAGRVIHKASVGSSDNGLTNKYMPYPVRQEDGSCLNFRLCDTPGIGEHSAMDVVNLHFLLDGHLPNSFQFSHSHHVSTKTVGFIQKPTLSDEVHSVAFVLDASTVGDMSPTAIVRLNDCKRLAQEKGIPIVVILTKIDKLHEEIEDNLADIFKCQEIKAVVDQVSETLGIPPNHVFPVKNYHSEMETEVDMHGLALIALRKLICMASDVLEERISGSEDSLAESTAITESDTA
ncbi:interferon-induced protein 44-like [Mya arenaria]|uniref:interferon-induced protein 44-like n=1 Tax=Mya arenaria TaxID=6604 RepID=UPI0022E7AFB3|nr:interferon-induced protein 44-like [Mya arenaria]XP_052786783.1 interferon-induced protein 44-like [Mya arenaria]XP_052786784.1 interferon-induced protein 44-like [Mya arenaria]XP_052786785.1 interferon-induced protein 44-like [Mya arenaria]XP_052786786.1 interferon-induced protein 44-like [Mya arenaria]XP_052786787.1 interferon-induced protein 44-like [Mya arenaria]